MLTSILAATFFSACASPTPTLAPLPQPATARALEPTAAPTLAPTVIPTPTPAPSASSNPACARATPLTISPIALENIVAITPLGNLNPPAHTFPTSHLYFNLPTAAGAPGSGPMGDGRIIPQVPVVSPGRIVLKSVSLQELTSTRSGKPVSYTEYSPAFAVCGGITLTMGHTGPLSPRLTAAIQAASPRDCREYSTGPDTVRACGFDLNVALEPGEAIGVNSGRSFGFDLGAFDSTARQQAFVQPERYGFENRYNVCPLDLFEPGVRAKFYPYLGQSTNQNKIQLRTSEPLCGTPMQDVAGTAQGNWFANPRQPYPEDNNLALVHDNIDPTRPAIAVGVTVKGLASNTYSFTPKSSGLINRDFNAIKPDGQVYCYEQIVAAHFASQRGDAVTLLVSLTHTETLRIEARQAGACGADPWAFSANAATFYR